MIENWAVSQKIWASKSQKYNKGTLPRSNNLEEMYKTVAIAQVSFAHMMPSLSLLGQVTYTRIMDGFLEHAVLSDRSVDASGKVIKGWNTIINQHLHTEDTLYELKEHINSYSTVNYLSPKESYLSKSFKCKRIQDSNKNFTGIEK